MNVLLFILFIFGGGILLFLIIVFIAKGDMDAYNYDDEDDRDEYTLEDDLIEIIDGIKDFVLTKRNRNLFYFYKGSVEIELDIKNKITNIHNSKFSSDNYTQYKSELDKIYDSLNKIYRLDKYTLY